MALAVLDFGRLCLFVWQMSRVVKIMKSEKMHRCSARFSPDLRRARLFAPVDFSALPSTGHFCDSFVMRMSIFGFVRWTTSVETFNNDDVRFLIVSIFRGSRFVRWQISNRFPQGSSKKNA